jgi:hypothetical protein
MVRTTLQASVSKTAAFNGTGVAVSALANPSSILLNVTSLTSGAIAIFEIQSSVDDFSADVRTEKAFTFKGPLASTYPMGVTVQNYDMAGLRVGTALAKIRIALTYISTGTVVYQSFLTTGA